MITVQCLDVHNYYMEDTVHHKQLRLKLMNQLHLKGINNVNVLEAMNRVPRHLFISEHYSASQAYEDIALDIGLEQTISQPYTVAYQTSLLNISPKDKILEVGTGSGYQAAVLFEMGAEVYTIERRRELYLKTHEQLIHLGYAAIRTFYGDGTEGLQDHAPFDRILVTAGATEIPGSLIQQLKKGGLLVLPLNTKMIRLTKTFSGEIEKEELDTFTFVPLLKGLAE